MHSFPIELGFTSQFPMRSLNGAVYTGDFCSSSAAENCWRFSLMVSRPDFDVKGAELPKRTVTCRFLKLHAMHKIELEIERTQIASKIAGTIATVPFHFFE